MKRKRTAAIARVLRDGVSAWLFIIMFVMFIAEVFFRYVLDRPISWSIELIMVAFMIMLFYTAALGVKLSGHISFNILYASLPPTGKRIFALVGNAVGLVVLALATPGVVNIALFERREATPILHIPFATFYLAFVLFVVGFAARLLVHIIQLLRPGWRDRL
ncbi:MAG: TRAP transporter small permease subunit [Deinococcales bacterium]